MKQYAEKFKESVIARMLPPNNVGIPELAMETGIPKDTLYSWRIKHRKSKVDRIAKTDQTGGFSSEEKFSIVVETASMNEARDCMPNRSTYGASTVSKPMRLRVQKPAGG